MSKHKAGPWRIRELMNGELAVYGRGEYEPITPRIPSISKEDARLIAAAPELLEALKLAKNSVECSSIDINTGEELPWYRAAKKAISKAEGKNEK